MRILFLTQVLPLPLDAGPKIRAYYVLRHLAESGHDVSLLTFVRKQDSQASIDALKDLCRTVETVPMVRSRARDLWSGFNSLLSRKPFLILRDERNEMRRKLRRLCDSRSFDAIHSDQLWMAPYALRQPGPRKILDQHNAVFQIPHRLAASERNPVKRSILRIEAQKLMRYEDATCRKFDQVVWVSRADLQALQRSGRRSGTSLPEGPVIPICVDPSLVASADSKMPRFRVTFLGGMHWPPNADGVKWFAEEVWPSVVRKAPRAILTVLGKQPPRLADSRNTECLGFVPNLDRYLAETAVFIVPLRSGGGMRVKILDAWSWRLPVVSTTIGAEGLDAYDHENVLLADTAEAFAESVVSILKTPGLAERLSQNGRATVETHYDWRKVYPSWGLIYS